MSNTTRKPPKADLTPRQQKELMKLNEKLLKKFLRARQFGLVRHQLNHMGTLMANGEL